MKAIIAALALCLMLFSGCCSLSAGGPPSISEDGGKKHYEGSGYSFDYPKNLTSFFDESKDEASDSASMYELLNLMGYTPILLMDAEGSLISVLIFIPQSEESISKDNCNIEYITNTNPDNLKRFCPKDKTLVYKNASWHSFENSQGCLLEAIDKNSSEYIYIFAGSCSKKNFVSISSEPANFLPIVSTIKCEG